MSAGQFAFEIDGAAAHSRDYAGALDLGSLELNENNGLARAESVGQNADDFEIEFFDLVAGEDSVGVALHAGAHLLEGQNFVGLRARAWRGCENAGDCKY